jgi:hypothetical protein
MRCRRSCRRHVTAIVVACVTAVVATVSGCALPTTHRSAPAVSPSSAPATVGSVGTGALEDVPASRTPAASPSRSTAPSLADGRSASYLKGVDLHARTVTFDLIVFLTGDAATKEWLKTHPDEPDGPPEGYLIINDNPQLRTLPLAAQVTVKVVNLNSPADLQQIKIAELPAHLSGERQTPLPYWLTVLHGQVTGFQEEYLA